MVMAAMAFFIVHMSFMRHYWATSTGFVDSFWLDISRPSNFTLDLQEMRA
jgi:hypothetical protein